MRSHWDLVGTSSKGSKIPWVYGSLVVLIFHAEPSRTRTHLRPNGSHANYPSPPRTHASQHPVPNYHTLPPELGINPSHILTKSLTVLNPLSKPDERIMDDADLAGPLFFSFGFGMVLLFVSS